MSRRLAVQEEYAPQNACFGCGPANPKGLRLKSYWDAQRAMMTADWLPEHHHEAFPGILNGGIIGTLLDCHSNWTAAYTLMLKKHLTHPPCTVTAYFNVTLLKPTPTDVAVHLLAMYQNENEIDSERVKIQATLFSGEVKCATCEGLFVAVKPGHPAYHRW